MRNAAVQKRAFPLAGLMCALCGIAHAHEVKAGITVPANASSSFSRRGDEESFETSTRTKIYWGALREEDFSIITTRGGKIFLTSPIDAGNLCTSTRTREGEFLESIKKGLLIIANPVYGYSAPAKYGAGISLPEMYRATHDAPSVFFCVVSQPHTFFSVTGIIRFARKIMVGCAGASSEAPVSLYAGKANPAQSTTRQISLCGGGSKTQYKEAAKWLLPLPKFRNSSGLSPQFAAICRQLPPKSITLLLKLSAKPAAPWRRITSVSLQAVSVWR